MLSDRYADTAVSDNDTVNIANRAYAKTGRSDEDFFRIHSIKEIDIGFFNGQIFFAGQINGGLSAHTWENVAFFWREDDAVLNNKNVAAFAFCKISICVQQECMGFRVCILHLKFGDD